MIFVCGTGLIKNRNAMKNVILCLFFVISLMASAEVMGQSTSKLSDFVIKYDVKIDGLENAGEISPEIIAMMPKTMTMYIAGNRSCMDMSSSFMSQKTITNVAKDEIITVMDMMGMKIAITAKSSDMGKIEGIEIERTGKKKTIAGYVCDEVAVSFGGNKFTVYVTKEIGFKGLYMDNPMYANIEGCMLEYNIDSDGVKVNVLASNVNKEKVDKSVFEIPSGCKKMTFEEAKSLLGN